MKHISRSIPALLTAAAVVVALGACSSAAPAGDDETDFGSATMQLGWIDNNQFAGEYMAIEQGYFEDAGFAEVTLTPGGSAATAAEAAVTSGQALLGVGDIFKVASAATQGGGLRIIGATFQKNPFALISMSADPIATPADLPGRTIAVPDTDSLLWETFLAANGVDPADVTVVPYLFDSSILTTGQVDGLMTFTTVGSELLNSQGFETQEFLLADYGLPLIGDPIVTSTDALENDRAALKAFLYALIQGWYWAAENPEEANSLTTSTYAAEQGYDNEVQLIAMFAELNLLITPETDENGLLTISDALAEANIQVLEDAGLAVTVDDIFDTSLLAEIYTEHPELLG